MKRKLKKKKASNRTVPKNASMTPSLHTHTYIYTHKEKVAKRLTLKSEKVPQWVFEQEWDRSPICALTPPDLQRLHQWCQRFVRWQRSPCDLGGVWHRPSRQEIHTCRSLLLQGSGAQPGEREGRGNRVRDAGQGFPVTIVWKNMSHNVTSRQNVPQTCC